MFQCGYGSTLSVWGQDSEDSDDNCDNEAGKPVPK